MKTKISYSLICVHLILFISSCEKDPEPVLSSPSLSNLEVGSGNNQIGVIGRDFHLNADIVAGDKIDLVQVIIAPIAGESYAGSWRFELSWEQFKGLKNTNVHQHFDIPLDAFEGKYEFTIRVTDENGTFLEERVEIQLVDPSNLEVDPKLYLWMITTDQGDFHYVNESLENPKEVEFSKGEILNSDATIKHVKGDGRIYLLLIKKDHNHLPESVADIDFSKVIVYDTYSHTNQEDVDSFSNVIYDGVGGYLRPSPKLTIGQNTDNNSPGSDLTLGERAWQSGGYYFGVVYTNSTFDISLHHYLEVKVTGI